ncbi:MAG: hypothetical protein O9972_63845 [Burkholderiales bacterium]|nr:hypothetical protein [Burkholderiales bacterium]
MPAATAHGKTGQHVLGPPLLPEPVRLDGLRGWRGGDVGQPVRHHLPERVVYDPQLGHVLDDPIVRRVRPRHALARRRILDEPHPVPHEPADIELVPQDARAPARVATNRGVLPRTPFRSCDAFLVQPRRDGAWRGAVRELREDPPDDRRLISIDHPLAADTLAVGIDFLRNLVAVCLAACRTALLDAAPQAPVRLRGEVAQEQRVHRALQADVQFVDLPLGQRHHPDAGERQRLVERGDVLLIAG